MQLPVGRHLELKLMVRLFMFSMATTSMLLLLGYNLWTHHIGMALAFSGVAFGLAVGLLVGRLSQLEWHHERDLIVAPMDKVSLITLACYLVFTFSKKWLFGFWLHGAVLTAFSFCILLGVMGARLFTTRQKIVAIMRERGI